MCMGMCSPTVPQAESPTSSQQPTNQLPPARKRPCTSPRIREAPWNALTHPSRPPSSSGNLGVSIQSGSPNRITPQPKVPSVHEWWWTHPHPTYTEPYSHTRSALGLSACLCRMGGSVLSCSMRLSICYGGGGEGRIGKGRLG